MKDQKKELSVLNAILIVLLLLTLFIGTVYKYENDTLKQKLSNIEIVVIKDTIGYIQYKDSIIKVLDTVFIPLKNNANAEAIDKTLNNDDSIAIVKEFIRSCSKHTN